MTPNDLYTIIGSLGGTIIVVGLALAGLIMRNTARLDADRRSFQAEAAADRRAFQAGMDEFRREMQRIADRQSHLEGRLHSPPTAAD